MSQTDCPTPTVCTCSKCGQDQVIPQAPLHTYLACCNCDAVLHKHVPRGIQRTLALSIAALFLFVPANLLPILSFTTLGYKTESTIWQGVVDLWKSGTPSIAVLVFACSILIPLAKIVGLIFVCTRWQQNSPKQNSILVTCIDIIGKWSMLDVFLVAVLVALVKMGAFASIHPQSGLVAFGAVVVLTMLASSSIDSRLFWQTEKQQ